MAGNLHVRACAAWREQSSAVAMATTITPRSAVASLQVGTRNWTRRTTGTTSGMTTMTVTRMTTMNARHRNQWPKGSEVGPPVTVLPQAQRWPLARSWSPSSAFPVAAGLFGPADQGSAPIRSCPTGDRVGRGLGIGPDVDCRLATRGQLATNSFGQLKWPHLDCNDGPPSANDSLDRRPQRVLPEEGRRG